VLPAAAAALLPAALLAALLLALVAVPFSNRQVPN